MNWSSILIKTKSLYWEPPVRDGYGAYKWSAPNEILCKWSYTIRGLKYYREGSEVIATTTVYTTHDSQIVTGGYLLRANLYDFDDLKSPPIDDEMDPEGLVHDRQTYARQILSVERVESVRSSNLHLTKLELK